MKSDPTWKEALATADHRIAIGATDVYLRRDDWKGLRWSDCVGMRTGGFHRLDIDTDVLFEFAAEGLTGRWYFELEKRGSNGSGEYHIDTEGVQRLLAVLPDAPKEQFIAYLQDCADKVEAQAAKYQAAAMRQYGEAAVLRMASKPHG